AIHHAPREGRVLLQLAKVMRNVGDPDAAARYASDAELHARALGDAALEADAAHQAAILRYFAGDYPGARLAVERAVAMFRAIHEHHNEATATLNLASVCSALGQYRDAQDNLRRVIVLAEQNGNEGQAASARANLAHGLATFGELAEAR